MTAVRHPAVRRGTLLFAAGNDRTGRTSLLACRFRIGMAADRIGTLFQEFAQADNSISRRFGGTGLGLAISKRLIDQMGGAITVESTPGQGTSFRVRLKLPIASAPLAEPRQGPDQMAVWEAMRKSLGRSPRLLYAEDNSTNQFVVRRMLKDMDVHMDMVANGLEAIEAASCFAYDVICMDMQMPEMDGVAATRVIRSRGGALATVPIIALTANAFPEDVKTCLDAGMNQFVTKPISREVLLTALLTALSKGVATKPLATVPSSPDVVEECFDEASLGQLLKEIGQEGLEEMIAIFASEAQACLTHLRTPGLDAAIVIREVHSIRGAAGAVYATTLGRRAARLETRLKSGESLSDADLTALDQSLEALMDGAIPVLANPSRAIRKAVGTFAQP